MFLQLKNVLDYVKTAYNDKVSYLVHVKCVSWKKKSENNDKPQTISCQQ